MKKLFSLLLAAALCLSCLCVPAMAADELSLKGTYAGGIVTVTGSGFTSNEDYPLISVKLPDVYPVAMDAKTANEDGRLELTVTTGTDNGGLDENPGKYS